MIDINRVIFAQREYRSTAPIEDGAIKTKHPLAVEMEYNSLLRSEADANTFGGFVLGLFKLDRWNWACFVSKENPLTPTLEVGQTIIIAHPRYGFSNGKEFIIKRIKTAANALFDELTLFGPNDSVASDTTPNSFSFTDQSGVAVSTVITSAPVTITGIDSPSTVTVSGGEWDKNSSGSWTTSSGTVVNNDTVRVRHTSSASNSTATNTTLTVGGVSDTFTSTTVSAAPWLPTDIGVRHWWDPADAATITKDGSNFVSQMNDKGTAAANASQATGGIKPLWVASSNINSKNALRITGGSNQRMTGSFDFGALAEVMCNGNLSSLQAGAAWLSATGYNLDNSTLIGIIWTASTAQFWANGTQVGSDITGLSNADVGAFFAVVNLVGAGTFGFGRLTGGNTMLFNRTGTPDRSLDGDVADMLKYSFTLTTLERQKNEGFLLWKAGLESLLPGGHPFAGSPP